MTTTVRKSDGMREVDKLEERLAALERWKAGENENRVRDLEAAADWLQPQEKFGTTTPAEQGGVAPGTAEGARSVGSGNTEMYAGAVGDMHLNITAERNCWWHVAYHCILMTNHATAWERIDPRIWFDVPDVGSEISDARGRQISPSWILPTHVTVGWQSTYWDALLKLEAGKSYGVRPIVNTGSVSYTYWHGGTYFFARSRVVNFW